MIGGRKQPTQSNRAARWRAFETHFKRHLITGTAALILLMTATIGPQFLIMMFGSFMLSALIFFPDDVQELYNHHKLAILFAAVGFVMGGGGLFSLLGVPLLGLVGHEIDKIIRKTYQIANDVKEKTEPYRHPIDYTTKRVQGLWARFTAFIEDMSAPLDVELDGPSDDDERSIEHIDMDFDDDDTPEDTNSVRDAALTISPSLLLLTNLPRQANDGDDKEQSHEAAPRQSLFNRWL